MSKKPNTRQGNTPPWQFMESNDKRREVWQQYEVCDITPVVLPSTIETYYLKLRKAGIIGRWYGSSVAERRLQDGCITNVVVDDGLLNDGETYFLICLLEQIISAQDIRVEYLTYKTCFDFFPSHIRKDVFYILLLEGINAALDTPDPFIFETEIDMVRSFAASCPNEEEQKALLPFLDFLAETETGKKVQAELQGISIQEAEIHDAEILAMPEVKDLFEQMEKAGYCTKEGDLYRWNKSIALWGYMVDEVSDCLKLRPSNDTIPWEKFAPAFTNIAQPQIKTAREAVSKYSDRKGKLPISNKPEGCKGLERVIYP